MKVQYIRSQVVCFSNINERKLTFVVGYLSECSGETCSLLNLEELPSDVKIKGLLKHLYISISVSRVTDHEILWRTQCRFS